MCQFWSVIVDNKLNLYDAVDINDSHETIISTHYLKDDKIEDREIVRLEVTPDVEKLTTRFNKKHWDYKVDEDKTLPKWYRDNESKIQKMVFDKLHDEIWQKYILVGGEYEELEKNRVAIVKN